MDEIKERLTDPIFKTIQIITNAELDKLSYDRTITGTIEYVENIGDEKVYRIRYGNSAFIAYSNDREYYKGQKVYITIPQGDFDQKKFILGTVSSIELDELLYTNPLDNIFQIENSSITTVNTNSIKDFNSLSVIANQSIETQISANSGWNLVQHPRALTRLGVSAEMEYNIASSVDKNYGVQIDAIFKNEVEDDLSQSKYMIATYVLDKNDIIGNVYNTYGIFYLQNKLFDISGLGLLYAYRVQFFKQNFLSGDSISVKNVKIVAGYPIENYEGSVASIFTTGSLEYENSIETRDIELFAGIKKDNGTFINLNSSNLISNGYSIKWYINNEYKNNYNNSFNITQLGMIGNANSTYVQAKIYEADNLETPIISSNIIYFNKKEDLSDTLLHIFEDNNFNITLSDNSSQGVYYVYDEANYILSEFNNSEKEVRIELIADQELSNLNNATITIDYPKTSCSNFIFTPLAQETDIIENISSADINNEFSRVSFKIKSNFTSASGSLIVLKYKLGSIYNPYKNNNIITIKIESGNKIYKNSYTFYCGNKGAFGTDYIITAHLEKKITENDYTNVNSINYNDNISNYRIVAQILDKNLKPVDGEKTITIESGGECIEYNNNSFSWKAVSENIIFSTPIILKIKYTVAFYEGNVDYITYFPISVTKGTDYTFTGPNKIIYNANGRLYSTVSTPFGCYGTNGLVNDCIFSGTNIKLKEVSYRVYCLQPESIYYKENQFKGYVTATYNNNKWIQPIVLIQNNYFSSTINSWDGKSVIIDENEGTILSTAFVAGRKNDENKFSGVLLGDVSKTVDSNIVTNTGIYGYKDGVLTYSLTDDGKATFGTAGDGQIIIDGTNSIIQSGDYGQTQKDDKGEFVPSAGMKIDLKNGTLSTYYEDIIMDNSAPIQTQIIKLGYNEDTGNFLEINDLDGESLIKIGGHGEGSAIFSEYYLKSSNYSINNGTEGSYFNLKDGILITNNGRFRGQINIGGDGSQYSNYLTVKNNIGTTLMNVGNDGYYLQSANFDGTFNPNGTIESSGSKGSCFDLIYGELIINNGRIRDSVTIGSGNNIMNVGDMLAGLNDAVDNIDIAASNAQKAANSASQAVSSIADYLTRGYYKIYYNGKVHLFRNMPSIKWKNDTNKPSEYDVEEEEVPDKQAVGAIYIQEQVHVEGKGLTVHNNLTVTNISAYQGDGTNGYKISDSDGDITATGTISGTKSTGSSDIRLKENLNYDLSDYEQVFLELKPVKFNFISEHDKANNIQIGFIAQEAKSTLDKYNLFNDGMLSLVDFGDSFGSRYCFNYNNITSLNTYMLQKLYARVEELEHQIKEIKEKL